jgi:hypothetical protein
VLAVRGTAAGLERGTPVDGRRWLDLAAGVEVALKHGATTREWTLRGPGRFLACENGEEVVYTARGYVETTPGAGTRAGAEVTLGAPFATVRYADAMLRLEVGDGQLVLAVSEGTATLEAVDTKTGSGVAPARSLSGPRGRAVVTGTAEPARLAERCSAATAAAETRAARPGAIPSGRAALASWAVDQLKARQAARMTCARARAAAGRLSGVEAGRLSGLIDARAPAPPAPGTSAAGAGK